MVAVGTRISPRPAQIPACAANAPGSSLARTELRTPPLVRFVPHYRKSAGFIVGDSEQRSWYR